MDSIFSYETIKLLKQKSSDVISKICTIQTIKNMRKDLQEYTPNMSFVLTLRIRNNNLGLGAKSIPKLDELLTDLIERLEKETQEDMNEIKRLVEDNMVEEN